MSQENVIAVCFLLSRLIFFAEETDAAAVSSLPLRNCFLCDALFEPVCPECQSSLLSLPLLSTIRDLSASGIVVFLTGLQ